MRTLTADRNKLTLLTKLFLFFFLVWCIVYSIIDEGFAVSGRVNTKDLQNSFSNQTRHFVNHFIKASEDDCAKIFGEYNTVIANGIDLKKAHFTSYQEVASLLDEAVKASIDSLTLFTHPLLQDKNGSAIIFSEDLLVRINQTFDFHGLFNITAVAAGNGSMVRMKFLVAGQGKFIVGYDRNQKIKHPDYNFATGNYDYNELFIMDARTDPKGNPGLFNIKALSGPASKPRWMKGPLNVDIQSLTMTRDPTGRRQILIKYNLFGSKHKIIDPIPIEKLIHR